MNSVQTLKKQSQINGAQGIVSVMEREEVDKVFCVPGESYLPVMDAIYDSSTIELVSNRHEGGAAFMAEGYAKASGKVGVVMATRGVGGANLTIGVHTAYQDSTPMIVLLGQVHSKFRGREGFQEVDLDQFFKPISKWTYELQDGDRAIEIMQRAFRVAQSGRPGPVVISLPEDVLKEVCDAEPGPPFTKPRPTPSQSEVSKLENLLAESKQPVVIAGGGIKSSQAEEALVAFAEKFHLPVITAFRRHDVFPHNHPLFCGHLGLGTNPNIIDTVKNADTVLAVGTRLSEVTTQDYSILSTSHKLVHIDISDEVLGKVYAPQLGIQADAKEALETCYQLTIQPTWKQWASERREAYEKASTLQLDEHSPINSFVIDQLAKQLPSDTIYTNDAGNFAGWLHTYFPFNESNTYVGPTSGAMGYGVPAAIGAKFAHPKRHVVSLSGDGGFMMTLQEIETAARNNLATIHLVFNNHMYGTIRMHQEMHYPEKVIGTNLGSVNFVQIAEGLGAKGILVERAEEFQRALSQAMDTTTPTVIEIMTDPEQISIKKTINDLRNQS